MSEHKPRTIKGPCFDCDDRTDDHCPCSLRQACTQQPDTARIPLLADDPRPRVPPLLLVLALVCLISGCLTPAKLAAWSTEAATISQASTDPKCVESALTLQSAIVRALDTQKTATQYMDGATAPDVDRARDEMMTACGVKR
jgi:hypothetical protein